MSDIRLGRILPPDGPEERDAAHVAVAPVIASQDLAPGTPISLINGSTELVYQAPREVAIGIVDPFLKDVVPEGGKFYMLLNPQSVTVLRHHWTHPAYQEALVQSKKTEAEEFMKRVVKDFYGVSVPELLESLTQFLKTHEEDDGLFKNSYYDLPDYFSEKELWAAYEILTGNEVLNKKQGVVSFCC